jgi:hypothetical protein
VKTSTLRDFIHGGYKTTEPLSVAGKFVVYPAGTEPQAGTGKFVVYPAGTEPQAGTEVERELLAVWAILGTECVCGHRKREHYAWTGHCTIGEEFDSGGDPQERGADGCARYTDRHVHAEKSRDGQQLERQGAYDDQLGRQDLW